MTNVLGKEKREQILALGRLGWSLRRIEAETGIRRETASAYLKAAGLDVRRPGRWGRPSPAKPAKQTSTDPLAWPPPPGRSPQASACEPYRELIERAVEQRRPAMAIWQDLLDDHGFPARYASVQRFVKQLRERWVAEAHPRIETAPGEEGQVDYGDGPMVRDPKTRKYRRTRLFVFTLGFSRKCVRFLVWKSSSRVWAELHERAFRRLGGATRTVVLDNLKEGVLRADVYDPTLNPLYRDVLAHYGVTALPCRVKHPDRKGKVESGIGHAQGKLRGLRFESLEEAQAYLDRWEERWADTRIHGTTKRQVAAMFAEEKPALLPLPVEPFRYYAFGERTVHLDGAIEVERAYYHLPPGWLGRRVDVRWDRLHVRILDPRSGALLREYVRQKPGGRRMQEEDRPKTTPPPTQALLTRAEYAGRHIGALCRAIYRREEQPGIRRIQGVLALARKHGAAAVDEICAEALALNLPTYRFVRQAVERRPALPLTLKQIDPLIRELTHYRDLIDRRTEGGDPT
jgi:transposase